MRLGRGGDGFGAASGQRIVTAHKPLKFGEFPNHFGPQVSLGDLRSLKCLIRISPDNGRNFAR